MNCRAFHRNLEDYLENALDFPGRFGMERHAQQCIGCGKALADAQALGQMARSLKRVKAPADFEFSLLREIGSRKLNSRFSRFRRLWIYGFEPPSWRKLALACGGAIVLLLGMVYVFDRSTAHQPVPQLSRAKPSMPQVSAPLQAPAKPALIAKISPPADDKSPVKQPKKIIKKAEPPQPTDFINEEVFPDLQDVDYVEYLILGPGNRPVTVRMPYGQPSEEYYIRNVSH